MSTTDSRADKLDESCVTKPLHLPSFIRRKYGNNINRLNI